MAKDYKSDRLSFVLDKELTPVLDKIARKMGITRSKLINETVIKIIMDNMGVLDIEEDSQEIEVAKRLLFKEGFKRSFLNK